MTMMKKTLAVMVFVLMMVSFVGTVDAITARLGSSRIVLNLEPGESATRSLLVDNVNDVPVRVTFLPGGDLEDSVELETEEVILEPGEEEKVEFTITATKPGTTETKINVLFSPDEGSGVGLSATIIVVSDDNENEFDELDAGREESADEEPNEAGENASNEESGFSFSQNSDVTAIEEQSRSSVSVVLFLTISTVVLVLVFVGLIVYARSRRARDFLPHASPIVKPAKPKPRKKRVGRKGA